MKDKEKTLGIFTRLGKQGQLINLVNNESDKGMVLSITAFIESTIQEIVYAFVVKNSASKDLEPNGHTSIVKRVRLACSLGLISELEMNVITKICNVRNEFAHKWDANFDDEAIKAKMQKLASVWLQFDHESNKAFRKKADKELFKLIGSMLLQDLVHRVYEVKAHQLEPIQWTTTWNKKMES